MCISLIESNAFPSYAKWLDRRLQTEKSLVYNENCSRNSSIIIHLIKTLISMLQFAVNLLIRLENNNILLNPA